MTFILKIILKMYRKLIFNFELYFIWKSVYYVLLSTANDCNYAIFRIKNAYGEENVQHKNPTKNPLKLNFWKFKIEI